MTTAFWHATSWDAFLATGLPRLLSERLPLASYHFADAGPGRRRVKVEVAGAAADWELPCPDADGAFTITGGAVALLPIASCVDLAVAEIRCAGDQALDLVAERLGRAPPGMHWDAERLREWLPLDEWIVELLHRGAPVGGSGEPASSAVALPSAPLARRAVLRRLLVPRPEDPRAVAHPAQASRTCPVETPEDSGIGRVLAVARGAVISEGRLLAVPAGAPDPEHLGLLMAMVPCAEHSDPNRLLMACSLLLEALPEPDPEPPLVATGLEPDGTCPGRDLLTAFVAWGGDTDEDGIVLSTSAAARLGGATPVEPGDRLANRHGSKGVVARVLPDPEMPHLPDGTPVGLCFSFIACHARLNHGQVREALIGRIAATTGVPVVVPPFAAPSVDELRRRAVAVGLAADGLERLRDGTAGPELARRSAVGPVRWFRVPPVAATTFRTVVAPVEADTPSWGPAEYLALRRAGAFAVLHDAITVRAADHPVAVRDVVAGAVIAPPPPARGFTALRTALADVGIAADLIGETVHFDFADPSAPARDLAAPVPHPWCPGRTIARLGEPTIRNPVWAAVVEADERLARMLAGGAPEPLRRPAATALAAAVARWLDCRLPPGGVAPLRLGAPLTFAARAVLAPGPELPPDRLGIPEEAAWTLFAPAATQAVGAAAVTARDAAATAALDTAMENTWVVLATDLGRTDAAALVAFRPVRVPGRVLRLTPLASALMNADFDGDVATVALPLTAAAQAEAGARLSLVGHLRRDPGLVCLLVPGGAHAAGWGLADLSLTAEGRAEIDRLIGVPVAAPDGFVTAESLAAALRVVLDRDGPESALTTADRLRHVGTERVRRSGASISPFVGALWRRPPTPEGDDAGTWRAWRELAIDRLAAARDFASDDLGVQLLACLAGMRGALHQLAVLVAAAGAIIDADGRIVADPHRYVDGYPLAGYQRRVVGARIGFARQLLAPPAAACEPPSSGWGPLARALRAPQPGMVFAGAAERGEVDPLLDPDARLLVGLAPRP